MGILDAKKAEQLALLLPTEVAKTIPKSQEEWKKMILENLETGLNSPIFAVSSYWLDMLSMYNIASVFTFTKDEMKYLIQTLYNYIIKSTFYKLVCYIIPIFVELVNYVHEDIGLRLDWRPVYNILYRFGYSVSKVKPKVTCDDYLPMMILFSCKCRQFYDGSETEAIFNVLKESITKNASLQYGAPIILFCNMVPTMTGDYTIWFDFLFEQWKNFSSPCVDLIFLEPLVSLASYNRVGSEWKRYLPLIFTRIADLIGVPTPPTDFPISPKGNSFLPYGFSFLGDSETIGDDAANAFTKLLVYLMVKDEVSKEVRAMIERLMVLIAPLHSPLSNDAQDETVLRSVAFLNGLVENFCRKIRHDRKGTSCTRHITEDDKEWFINMIMPIYQMEMYHPDNDCIELKHLIEIKPEKVVPIVLEVCERISQYDHLRSAAAKSLTSLAPVSIISNVQADKIISLAKTFVDNISSQDPDLTCWVFSFITSIAWSMDIEKNFGHDFILLVIRRCIEFAATAEGDDMKNSLSMMEEMLDSIYHKLTPEMKTDIEKLLEESVSLIPVSCISQFIDSLTPKCLIKTVTETINEKNVKILTCIVRSSRELSEEFNMQVIDVVKKGINDSNLKVKKHSCRCLKWLLRYNLIIFPLIRESVGVSPVTKDSIEWHIPTPENVKRGLFAVEEMMKEATELYAKNEWHKQLDACDLIVACIKGIVASVRPFDLGEPLCKHAPELYYFTDKKVSEELKKLTNWVIERLRQNPHHKVIARMINALQYAIIPINDLAGHYDNASSQFEDACENGRLSVMYPAMEGMTPFTQYILAFRLISGWLLSAPMPYTTYIRDIIDEVTNYIGSKYDTVSSAVLMFISKAIQSYQRNIGEFLPKAIAAFQNSEEMYAISGAASCIVLLCSSLNFEDIVTAALALCKPSPTDKSGEVIHKAQVAILNYLEDLNLDQTDINLRKKLIRGVIEGSKKYPTVAEVDNFAIAVVSACGDGLFMNEMYEFVIQHISADDVRSRRVAVYYFTASIERLIPRIPIQPRKEYDEINFDNYDNYAFKNYKLPLDNRHESVLAPKEQMLSLEFQKKYFDNPEERVEVIKTIFDGCDNDEFAKRVSSRFSDEQNQEQVVFSYEHFFMWTTLTRFLGPSFGHRLLTISQEMMKENSPSLQITAFELLLGVMQGVGKFKSKDIIAIKDKIFELFKQSILIDNVFSWSWAIEELIGQKDPETFFWFRDMLEDYEPPTNQAGTKITRQKSDILAVLRILSLYDDEKLEALAERFEDIFNSKNLEFDYARQKVIPAVSSMMGSLSIRGFSETSEQIFYDNIMSASDEFMSRWLNGCFASQGLQAASALNLALDNVEYFASMAEEKDEEEQGLAMSGVLSLLQGPFFLDHEEAVPIVESVLEQLVPGDKHWPVQTLMLAFAMVFISSNIFFIDDEVIEKYIDENVIPSLSSTNSAVQNAAMTLMASVLREFPAIAAKSGNYVKLFKEMLEEKDSPKRSAGAKGLVSIVYSSLIFDHVDDNVLTAFEALDSAVELGGAAGEAASVFFSDFWQTHEENITSQAEEALAPFVFAVKPSYIT